MRHFNFHNSNDPIYKEVIYLVWTCFFFLQVDDLGHSAGKVDQRIGQISSVQDGVTSVKPVTEEKGKVTFVINDKTMLKITLA